MSVRSKAVRFMSLRKTIMAEKNYIERLKRDGKPFEHRLEILKMLESELRDERKGG